MKGKKSSQEVFRSIAIVFAVILAMNLPAEGGKVGIDSIDIIPAQPTEFEPIEITTGGWIGYVLDIKFLYSEVLVSGTSIELDYYFLDTNPEGPGLPLAGGWDNTDWIGLLSADTYDVTATAWIVSDPLFPDFPYVSDVYTTSFTVIPEPATILLLGFSALILRKKRNASKKRR